MSISDARKVSTDIAMKSWQRKWDEDSKGRRTYELIPKVGTKTLWPRKRDRPYWYFVWQNAIERHYAEL